MRVLPVLLWLGLCGRSMANLHLVFDFDGTITEADTTDVLARASITRYKGHRCRNLRGIWDDVVDAYLADYKKFDRRYWPAARHRTTVAQELRYLEKLKPVEEASLNRVSETRFFARLDDQALYRAGIDAVLSGRVVVRPGFRALLELAYDKGWQTDILSANWSRAFIRGVLHAYPDIRTTSNEVTPSTGELRGTNLDLGRLTTSSDKLKALQYLTDGDQGPVIYFGDSTTDLACLLHVQGVILAANKKTSLMKTVSRLGLDAPHVSEPQEEQPALTWASDFHDILDSGILEM
ncbi:hypothetical protein DCS_07478 [Drechmeria coniospora]|uniref:Haloacid dehalogenase-like hydrolase n=1 Tax=Drechmeria coniospora TaxID=98403 RepID=A0A151GEK0_DRECN|nr:hypothetical protein DCS_07478 [Drechmeria coniospora]KYK55515.1 hypothetical protein DCS_07478 [Drechmeria coniospora]ODA81877.1 hypothetical protein RJ55_00382 [Drechmeria coniospora]